MPTVELLHLLSTHGPSLTSDLIDQVAEAGVSEAAARKRIQRASDDYTKLAGIRFEKNARFIYLPEQFGTPKFWARLEEALSRAGRSYWCAIVRLRAHGGICRLSDFSALAGAPRARKQQLSPERILERLKAVNILETVEDTEGQTYVRFQRGFSPSMEIEQIFPTLLAEDVALHAIAEWAKNLGLGSYGKFLIRGGDQSPNVSGIDWTLSAPSYIRPLVSIRAASAIPGFIVCDINLMQSVGEDEANAYVRKCDMAAAPIKVPPILPILVAFGFEPTALSILKSKGVLAVTLGNLFGSDLAEALRELINMLSDLGLSISQDPGMLKRVMDSLTKVEGAAQNVRASLFELLIGSLIRDIEGGYLKTGERILDPISGAKAEMDVHHFAESKERELVVECKAKLPGSRVSEEDVKRWYTNRVPLIFSILTKGRKKEGTLLRFELWTNGEFSDSALKWLDSQSHENSEYEVAWKDGAALKEYAKLAHNASYTEMLNQHYFRGPLRYKK